MSSSDFSEEEETHVGGPSFEVVYPIGEETEVPNSNGQLFKTVLTEGNGSKPPRNSKVTVSYKGTLASDGSVFDSSDSFDFTIGAGQVIKGWDQGVATMRKGERAILRCLPEYAYGAAGSPPTIPANATLNFEVEVKDWTKCEDISETRDKSLLKRVHSDGRNWETAEYESLVKADVKIVRGISSADEEEVRGDVLFERENWEIVIGETLLPYGLERALCSMKEGEEATVTVDGRHVVAEPSFGITEPKGEGVTFAIKIHSLHKVKTWTYRGMEKVTEGAKRKDAGNEHFKKGEWAAAEKKYRRCLEFVDATHDFTTEEEKQAATVVKLAALNNLAQVLINVKRYQDAIIECNKVLTTDGGNAKALFRRGKALGLADEWDEALRDLNHLLELDPSNGDAAREVQSIKAKVRAHEQSQKSKFSNMFGKLAAMEEREHEKK
mmetsp:Transcript_69165/g.80639  ORF Transcript_69165/g.80639 Transcript_69165/m.80639 type:complete len:439 (+) Transcript_69165:63-1379(+)